ncbi:MAG: dihydrofolate reductase family protein [Microgenomates group bacterium]
MHIILPVVASVNGNITKGTNPHVHSWASKEDASYFSDLKSRHNLLVMGSKTYETSKEHMEHAPGKLRVIMTRSPEKYAHEAIPNILEFTSQSVPELLKELENRGFKDMLLVGGGEINGLFLAAHVVNEVWVTIEPQLFGSGRPIFESPDTYVNLTLQSTQQLNKQGTLLIKYTVS